MAISRSTRPLPAHTPRWVAAGATRRSPARQADPDRGADGGPARLQPARPCPCAGDCPRCGGRPLPAPLAGALSRHLGADLSAVRLHTGAAAAVAAAGARRAFAQGDHIVIAASQVGVQDLPLLAHEAAHVVQQRGGAGHPSASTASLESEARRSAAALATGQPAPPVQPGRAAAGAPQFDEPASPPSTAGEEPDELRAQAWFADWLAQQQQLGAGGAGGIGATRGVPLRWLEPPSLLGAETLDVGSLYTPYHQRNLFPGGGLAVRDAPVIDSLFADRFRFVSLLPEVRDIVPSFARPWIPANWRVGLAATLTSTTVDWALSRDHPNFFDLSNRSFEQFTGATTYSTPMLPVPVLNGLWNRFSGGGR